MNVSVGKESAKNLWNICGSFGEFLGCTEISGHSVSAENDVISVTSTFTEKGNGVTVRTGSVRNISDKTISLYTLSSKFVLNGGEYEVYSQYNGWQNESTGSWQPLVTEVSARSESIRNAFSAAPFMALWNDQTNRGTAFHLSAFSAWEMHIRRVYAGGEFSCIEAELGVLKDGLNIRLEPGETLALPEIIYYDFGNKTDMDCWKLHRYLNREYPRKAMPVIYNTWLYKFDRFTFDELLHQIDLASEIGAEYFVIDAGWFGSEKDWWSCRGDWEETQTVRVCGKTAELSAAVRSKGMKFGFWLEPESASFSARILQNHPEYFIKGSDSCFLDFSNAEALNYIFEKTCELVDKFQADFIKFDFNADLNYDSTSAAFIRYFEGYKNYIARLREKYPDLYLENCASGGMRMTLQYGMLHDSFWLSDNQSPYHGMRIFRDTILRMPPQWIERWAAVRSVRAKTPVYGSDEYTDKIISTNDATWNSLVGVHQSFLNGFLTGSPIGLSFDLGALSEGAFSSLAKLIADFKADRDFWQNAVCHILTDTKSVLTLEYRNEDFSRAEIITYVYKAMQKTVTVYPVLDGEAEYRFGDKTLSAEEIGRNGIELPVNECYSALSAHLVKVSERNATVNA